MYKYTGVYPMHQLIGANPPVAEAPIPGVPRISRSAVIGPNSIVLGDVTVADDVFIGFNNVIRADASPPYYIGPRSNLQDYVMVHCHPGQHLEMGDCTFGVHIEGDVSILHHAAAHGPLYVGRNTFIGQHVSIYNAVIGSDCVIMHGAVVTEGVRIGDGRFVEPGQTVWKQEQADALPDVPPSLAGLNAQIVDYYYRLGKAYRKHTSLMI